MRIGILHRLDIADVRTLSGSPWFMAKALRDYVGEIQYLSPETSLLVRGVEQGGRILNRVSFSLLKRRFPADHSHALSKVLAAKFEPKVAVSGCDVIFAPNASAEIAYMATRIPIVYLSDLNWADIVDYYPGCSQFFDFAYKDADAIDAAAIAKAQAVIYSSEWAAQTAMRHYGADPQKVFSIPYGANFSSEDVPSRQEALRHTLDEGITLLWVGVDWDRKGGAIAHECLLALLERGVDAKLVVCGCIPPTSFRHPKLEIVPFLNKLDQGQRKRLTQLFLRANFFLFPTIAEAFGIVLCEASAHGVPSLVRDTGGVRDAVTDGENGYLLPPTSSGSDYAKKILEITQDPQRYLRLVISCRDAYEVRLNWDAWGRAVKPIFEQMLRESNRETSPS